MGSLDYADGLVVGRRLLLRDRGAVEVLVTVNLGGMGVAFSSAYGFEIPLDGGLLAFIKGMDNLWNQTSDDFAKPDSRMPSSDRNAPQR